MLQMAWYCKTNTFLASVYNDLDNADDADDNNGISKCEHKIANTHPMAHPMADATLWLRRLKPYHHELLPLALKWNQDGTEKGDY